MPQHLYAFGSICRGEVDLGSDIDLLACVDDAGANFDREKFSIYSYAGVRRLWAEGNPFAWHLRLESALLYSSDGSDFLKTLGEPEPYNSFDKDAAKFSSLFKRSFSTLQSSRNSATFHLSCVFLAIRNFATCYSLTLGKPIFSRLSPLMVSPKLEIDSDVLNILLRARLLSTRGYGDVLTRGEVVHAAGGVQKVSAWMSGLVLSGHL